MNIWEGELKDEGARDIVIIQRNNSLLKLIILLNCNIGPLGCEFINTIFGPSLPSTMEIYNTIIYNNNFGNEGLGSLLSIFLFLLILFVVFIFNNSYLYHYYYYY